MRFWHDHPLIFGQVCQVETDARNQESWWILKSCAAFRVKAILSPPILWRLQQNLRYGQKRYANRCWIVFADDRDRRLATSQLT